MLFQLSNNTRGNRRTHADAVVEHLQNYAALVLRELLFEVMLRTVRTVRPLMTACSDRLRTVERPEWPWRGIRRDEARRRRCCIPAVSDDRPTRFFDPLARLFEPMGKR